MMRAVWSFWSKPFESHYHRFWFSATHHFYAWVLSVETARRHYPRTALHTDDAGARLLVDKLGLKFEQVFTSLNALSDHDPDWWTLGKIHTYRAQTEPFVHIDDDVFLWEPLPAEAESASVFAQSPELFSDGVWYYHPEEFEAPVAMCPGGWLPEEWRWYRSAGVAQRGDCTGVFGGHRVDFIQHYASQALNLVEHPGNQPAWMSMQNRRYNGVVLEQYLLSACVEYHARRPDSPYRGIEMKYVFGSSEEAFNPKLSSRIGYTHLMGPAKRHHANAERLERRVKRDYPAHYERCMNLAGIGEPVS
jgi:hypothetical protein